ALERHHNEHPVAYFDGPGGTQVPRAVADAMVDYLYHHNANTEWSYPTSAETDAALASAREAFADFLNASPREIAFGANMTTLTLHFSRAIGRNFSPGDEIVVTELDHHANSDPWRELARDLNLEVKVARLVPETGQLDWEHYESLLSSNTKLVAVGAASNALGTVTDVKRAAEMAHRIGALVFVDAVHYAPHVLPDVAHLDCDFLACSAYKFYGPHVGIVFGKLDLLERISFPKLRPAHHNAPDKAETGTLNHEGIVGAAAAVDFLASLSSGATRRARLDATFAGLHARGSALGKALWDGLSAISGVTVYGPRPGVARTPTVAFTVAGVSSRRVASQLSRQGVFVSHGDFYALTVVERLGLAETGLVRAGCSIYTTREEVERLVEGVQSMAKGSLRDS
ncbi:MAG TPA: cysteine desulfurase-like protein, partial [Gemmatimonadaceae bacterium]|nr:cysteine desulfurase-like protein [Gemmatimonadaceae bacterium]